MALTSKVSPKIILEKPISPASLVNAICRILGLAPKVVEAVDKDPTDERNKIAKLIQETDSDTLRKIRALLNKKKKTEPYFLFE
jgi:hypothetical protein